MRRRLAAVIGLSLIATLALALAPSADWTSQGDRAAAAECIWHRHSKRVVKRVRRHGRGRRVSLTRHWWSCDEAPAPAAVAPTSIPAPTAPAPTQPEPEANAVSVTSRDQSAYSYTLSRPRTRTGQLTVELDNQGEDPHNLNLQLEGDEGPVYKIAKTEPSQHQVASFELPAGTYRLWCSIPTHDEKGMHATLIVAAE